MQDPYRRVYYRPGLSRLPLATLLCLNPGRNVFVPASPATPPGSKPHQSRGLFGLGRYFDLPPSFSTQLSTISAKLIGPFFCNTFKVSFRQVVSVLQHHLVQRQLRHQPLDSPILFLQLFELEDLVCFQPLVLFLSPIQSPLRDPYLPVQFCPRHPLPRPASPRHDLLYRNTVPLHGKSPFLRY
jgi:hypothetical protein